MANEKEVPSEVYYHIAQALVLSPDFIHVLEADPRGALEDVLKKGGIPYDDNLLNSLVAEYEAKRANVLPLARAYLSEIRPAVM